MTVRNSQIRIFKVRDEIVVAPKELSGDGIARWYQQKFGADVDASDAELMGLTTIVDDVDGERRQIHEIVRMREITPGQLPIVIL